MPPGVNSSDPFRSPRRNSAAENLAISRYPAVETLLAAIDRALVNLGLANEDPAGFADGNTIFQLLAEVGPDWICATLPRVSASSLWFIIAVYLEARREPMYWYELSDDHANHIVWVLSLKEKRHDAPRSPRGPWCWRTSWITMAGRRPGSARRPKRRS